MSDQLLLLPNAVGVRLLPILIVPHSTRWLVLSERYTHTHTKQHSMELEQAFMVLLCSAGVSLLTEFISWVLVYRTSGYKRIKDELDRNSKKWEQYKQQSGGAGSSKKDSNEKKEKKLEEQCKESIKNFQAVKMKANMVTAVVNLFVLNRLLAAFEGVTGGLCTRLCLQRSGRVVSPTQLH